MKISAAPLSILVCLFAPLLRAAEQPDQPKATAEQVKQIRQAMIALRLPANSAERRVRTT